MTERERFRRLMRGDAVDRPPLFEEGVRNDVLRRWHREGLPAGATHCTVFGLTPHENVGPDLTYRPRFFGRIVDLSLRDYRHAFDVTRRRFPSDWLPTVARLSGREHVVCLWASRGFLQALGVGDWPTLERALLANSERLRGGAGRAEALVYGDDGSAFDRLGEAIKELEAAWM